MHTQSYNQCRVSDHSSCRQPLHFLLRERASPNMSIEEILNTCSPFSVLLFSVVVGVVNVDVICVRHDSACRNLYNGYFNVYAAP